MKKLLLCLLSIFCINVYATSDISTTPVRPLVILDMPISFDSDHEGALVSLETQLKNVHDTDFIIRLEGLGGDVFLVNDFIRAMEDSQKEGNTISFDVIGVAASGHAYITCQANKVTMRPGSSLLFHQVYGIGSLFLGYIQFRELSDISVINNMTDSYMQLCLRSSRLTQKDIDVIKSGDDVIILSQQGKIIKQYEQDAMTFVGFTIPLLLSYISNILAILVILGSILYVWRRIGK